MMPRKRKDDPGRYLLATGAGDQRLNSRWLYLSGRPTWRILVDPEMAGFALALYIR